MGKNLSRATYWTPDWFRTSRNPTSDWLIQKKREKQWDSWKITIFGIVISKENTCELLLFLFQITCPQF
jgi:hypothetical protein